MNDDVNVFADDQPHKWIQELVIAHPSDSNDDDHPGGVMPIALAVPVPDEPIMAPPEQPHRPWLVPGRDVL